MKPHWLLGLAFLPIGYAARRLRNDPQFGATKQALKELNVRDSIAWRQGKFRNLDKTPLQEDLGSLLGDMLGYIQAKKTQPAIPLPAVFGLGGQFKSDEDYLTWYGHSALRLESGGQTVLLDPMLGEWVAPVPFLGYRFPYEDFRPLEDLGEIDLIVFSHDHYDHLDYDTLMQVKDRTKAYLVPIGVGEHLRAWGIAADKITEIDWWQTAEFGGIEYTAVPARHFSGRSPGTRNRTLWCGYAIETNNHRILFGGDSGYGRHFPEIGKRLGGFDLTLLDSGQYHHNWKNVHMQPEESLQAHKDVNGRLMLPIHWGGFSLSDHAWFDPIERITRADSREEVISPRIGERFAVGQAEQKREKWWKNLTKIND